MPRVAQSDDGRRHQSTSFSLSYNELTKLLQLTLHLFFSLFFKAWSAPYQPLNRLSGVIVFLLFTLYPTLVASIASVFNCSKKINGKQYLLADMSVQCYEGWHIGLTVFAILATGLYAVGIPVGLRLSRYLKHQWSAVARLILRLERSRGQSHEYSANAVRKKST